MLWTSLAVRKKSRSCCTLAQLLGDGRGPLLGEMGRLSAAPNPPARRPQTPAATPAAGRGTPRTASPWPRRGTASTSPSSPATAPFPVDETSLTRWQVRHSTRTAIMPLGCAGTVLPPLPSEHVDLLAVMVGVAGLAIGGGVGELVAVQRVLDAAGGIAGSRSCAR